MGGSTGQPVREPKPAGDRCDRYATFQCKVQYRRHWRDPHDAPRRGRGGDAMGSALLFAAQNDEAWAKSLPSWRRWTRCRRGTAAGASATPARSWSRPCRAAPAGHGRRSRGSGSCRRTAGRASPPAEMVQLLRDAARRATAGQPAGQRGRDLRPLRLRCRRRGHEVTVDPIEHRPSAAARAGRCGCSPPTSARRRRAHLRPVHAHARHDHAGPVDVAATSVVH